MDGMIHSWLNQKNGIVEMAWKYVAPNWYPNFWAIRVGSWLSHLTVIAVLALSFYINVWNTKPVFVLVLCIVSRHNIQIWVQNDMMSLYLSPLLYPSPRGFQSSKVGMQQILCPCDLLRSRLDLCVKQTKCIYSTFGNDLLSIPDSSFKLQRLTHYS